MRSHYRDSASKKPLNDQELLLGCALATAPRCERINFKQWRNIITALLGNLNQSQHRSGAGKGLKVLQQEPNQTSNCITQAPDAGADN